MVDIRKGGTNMGDALRSVMAGVERRDPEMVMSARTTQAWNIAATDVQLAHTDHVYTVPGTKGSEVVIYVDSNIWATELNLQSELLRLQLNLVFRDMMEEAGIPLDKANPERVKKLRFAASKERYRGKRPDDVSTQQQLLDEGMHYDATPVPLTEEEERAILKQVSHIENPAIRKAAFDAMKADAELKKALSQ